MLKAYKYKLLPNSEQKLLIDSTIGATRFVYNNLLADYKQQLTDSNNDWKNSKIKEVTSLKPTNTWLKDVDSLALANAKLNLQTAFKNFFDSKKGKRSGKRVGFPAFHSKHKSKWRYKTNSQNDSIRVVNNTIKLPKIGFVKFIQHKCFTGTIKSCFVVKNKDNTYYVSVLVQTPQETLQTKDINSLKVVGIDLSYSEFAVDSENNDEEMKTKFIRHYRKNEKQHSRLQRKMSKKQIGSKNRDKCRMKLAKFSQHIANCHSDFCHKTSRFYAKNYDVIVLEDIDLQRNMRNGLRGHAKSISDLCFGKFRNYLQYKALEENCAVVKVDKWFASSKLCNVCGTKNTNLSLSDRVWVCPHCGVSHNRDVNAALNLKNWFVEQYNRVGSTRIHAWGDGTATLQEIVGQVLSVNREAPSNT